jgi:tripartite ATP-independent transporter DctP family solute receptor
MKKFAPALFVISILIFSACARTSAAERVGATVLNLSFNQSIDNPQARTMLLLSDKLYDATNGRYSIQVFPNEELGPQRESLELVQAGVIEMALVANSLIENVVPDFAIIGTPYIYDSIEHQKRLFQSGALDELFRSAEPSGFSVLSAYSLGPRNIYTRTGPVTRPEDLEGLRIRVMQSDTMVRMLNYMGGVGTPMGQGDVYSAIQAGVLDGAENNIITFVDLLQFEVAPYYSETNHLMIPDLLVISNVALQGMSEEDRVTLRRLANESVGIFYDMAAELREEYRARALEFGVVFTEVDITPFQERMAPFIEEITNRTEMTRAVAESIRQMR